MPWSVFSGHTQYLKSEDVIATHGKWPVPDTKVAEQEYNKSHAHHSEFSSVWGTPTNELKQFGQGHMLYFYFLKYAAIVFCLFSIYPTIPLLVAYLNGPWLTSKSGALAALASTTIANYGLPSTQNDSSTVNALLVSNPELWPQILEKFEASNGTLDTADLIDPQSAASEVAISLVFMSDAANPPTTLDNGWDKRSTINAMAIIDLSSCIIFLIATLVFGWHTKNLALKQQQNTVTIHDYSVRVEGLPADVKADEVQKYFEEWGEVVLVELARECEGLMDMVWERKDILVELEEAVAKLQRTADLQEKVDEKLVFEVSKLKYDLSLVTAAIKSEQKWQSGNTVVDAFITYQEEEQKKSCIEANPSGLVRRMFMKKNKLFRDTHRIKVTDAPEPSDVKFENLEVRKWKRWGRHALSYFFKTMVLILGFILVSIAPAIQRTLGDSTPTASLATCRSTCDYVNSAGDLSLSSENREKYEACHWLGVLDNALSCGDLVICYDCFCKTAMGNSDITEASYCSPYRSILYVQGAAQALSVLSILAVNLLVPIVIDKLSKFEKHHTRSTEARSTAMALLIMFFLNTAISIMIANAYLPTLNDQLGDSWLAGVLFNGVYPDLTPNWYIQVGAPVLLSQLLAILSRSVLIYLKCYLRTRRMKYNFKCLTQRSLNHSLDGHEFELDNRYGEQLSVVFICMLFSSAIPILYWIMAVSFTVSYWHQKYELLQVCKKPIMYNADLAVFASAVLPWSAIFHLAFACWAFSLIAVQPSPIGMDALVLGLMKGVQGAWESSTVLTYEEVSNRILQYDSFPFFLFFLLGVLMLLLYIFVPWIKLYRKARNIKESDLSGKSEFLVAVRTKLLVGPTSYNIREQPVYEEAFREMEDYQLSEEEKRKLAEIEKNENKFMNNLLGKERQRQNRRRKAEMRQALEDAGTKGRAKAKAEADSKMKGEEQEGGEAEDKGKDKGKSDDQPSSGMFASGKIFPESEMDATPPMVEPRSKSKVKKLKPHHTSDEKPSKKFSYFDDPSAAPIVNPHHKNTGRSRRPKDKGTVEEEGTQASLVVDAPQKSASKKARPNGVPAKAAALGEGTEIGGQVADAFGLRAAVQSEGGAVAAAASPRSTARLLRPPAARTSGGVQTMAPSRRNQIHPS